MKIRCLLACLLVLAGCHSAKAAERTLGKGCFMTAPASVNSTQPLTWSVFITNTTEKTLRMDVGISVDAMEYYGKPYSRLFEVSVTNVLASGEFRVFPFTLEAGWCPTNPPPFDSIRFFACVFNRTDMEMGLNFLHASVADCTNSISRELQFRMDL